LQLKQHVKNIELEKRIFAAYADNFNELVIELFNHQYQNNIIYRQFCDSLQINADEVDTITQIPFLPISFFKTHAVKTGVFETDTVFESSGTTQSRLPDGQAIASKRY
jgi:Acyl-protein synthetase, LuxE